MEQFTEFGKAIIASDPDCIRLDLTVKNILAYKPILSRIFKEVVSECRHMNYEEIEACIEGEMHGLKLTKEFILVNDFRCRSTGLANAIPVRLLYQKRQLIAFASIRTR